MKTQNFIFIITILFLSTLVSAQTNEFTFQGRLAVAGTPSSTYDFEFRLCDVAVKCSNPLETLQRLEVPVSNGAFTVKLDFSAALFNGTDRWLEVAVKGAKQPDLTTLAPLQRITSTPYAIKSQTADTATTAGNAIQLDGLGTNRFVKFSENGDVQIGDPARGRPAGPVSKLTVAGVIESTAGGFKFPDATTQTTAGLTSVTTDATLTGNGTPALPLSVVSSPVDNSPFQPFQASTGTHGAVLVTVPAGKRLVIEYISGYQLYASSTQGTGTIQIRVGGTLAHFLAPLSIRTIGANTVYSVSQPVRIYAAAGQQIQVFFDGVGTIQTVALSGYYVDVPAASSKTGPGS